MGCFLGCFGLSSKRKRRKPANRILPGDSKLISYEPLDSSVSVNLDIPEDPITSNSELSNKPKERSSTKIRKKVSFNLNVQTYEPIPAEETTTYQFLQSVEEKETEKKDADARGGGLPSNSLQMGSYPANHRYQNCRESYDEEDEMAYEDSDLEDDDYFDDDDDDDGDYSDEVDKDVVDDQRQRQEELLDRFDSLNMESPAKNKMPLSAPTDGEFKSPACGNPRIRSQYLCSVLNPVENTTQWKEIKARAAPPTKYGRKENIAVEEEPQIPLSSKLSSNCSPRYNQSRPLLQDIAVDASLSNWLTSTKTDEPKTTGSTEGCSIAFYTLSSKKSTCDGSFSWRSREDRVVLDINNFEAL